MDELRSALELATDEELRQITNVLFCRRLNPLDYIQMPDAITVQSRDRQTWLQTLEDRFRYLAADGFTVLRGRSHCLTYREALVQVCTYLKIPYDAQMAAIEIEAEIFLHLLGRTWQRLPAAERRSLTARVQKSLAQSGSQQPLPVELQHNPINFLLKGSGAIAMSSVVRQLVMQQVARQFALHFARYQAAKTALVQGGNAAWQIQQRVTLHMAKRGMAAAAARQSAARLAFAWLGPLLWGTLLADLGWRAIATNHGRIIPTIFTLAQIRLTRSECWEAA
ncbi:MAG: hypothetical protein HC910_12005 [Spirulinaceae cyanobacterium SM2_1_0]|nr:hypothetical protein [Spirulinaceae cyanobacterium SM2_1_0]